MAGDGRRSVRLSEAIRQEVASFLAEGGGVKDPRITGLVTVTGVDVTRDLRRASVYVSIMGDDDERQRTLEGLESLASHLRSRLGRSMRLRSAPEVTFRLDQSIARAARIESLLAQLRGDPPATGEGGASD
ncbi:MAG: 30S ribosome-binding factor RbfA [Gemmatimonadota bacterium]